MPTWPACSQRPRQRAAHPESTRQYIRTCFPGSARASASRPEAFSPRLTSEWSRGWMARPLEEIEADIRAIEADIVRMLAEVTGTSPGDESGHNP